ncbi:MAG: hypothetical protein ACK2UF_21845, partial [Candidatus Promineifilaceae bacterium]
DIQLPPEFPEKYKAAVIRAADQCAVKKHFEYPPQFEVFTSTTSTEQTPESIAIGKVNGTTSH